jgi:hypothetical protein
MRSMIDGLPPARSGEMAAKPERCAASVTSAVRADRRRPATTY